MPDTRGKPHSTTSLENDALVQIKVKLARIEKLKLGVKKLEAERDGLRRVGAVQS